MTSKLRNWLNPDRAFLLAFSIVFLAVTWATLPGFGLAWDAWEFYLGDQNLAFYATLDSRYLDYATPQPGADGKDLHELPIYRTPGHPDFLSSAVRSRGNPVLIWPHQVWPLGATLACLGKFMLFPWTGLDVFDATHAIVPLYGVLLAWLMYGWTRRRIGRTEAVLAVLLLACHPRWWAHLHFNFKDVPAVWLYALAAFGFYEGIVVRRWPWLIVSSVAWGAGMATKGNALLLPLVLIPWFAWALVERRRRGERLVDKAEWYALAVYPFLGLLVMFLLWPYLLADFPTHLQAYIHSLFERGLEKPSVEAAGWRGWIPPINLIATTPLPMLIPAVAGLAIVLRRWWRDRRPDRHGLLLVLWLIVPIGRVMLPGARDFDVIRHWLEVLVPVAIFAGIGCGAGIRWLKEHLPKHPATIPLAVAVWLSPTVIWNVRNYPNNLVYYNLLVGGLQGARHLKLPEATDYWADCYRQAYRWIDAHAPEGSLLLTGVAEHLTFISQDVWLRPDIKVLPLNGVDEKTYLHGLAAYPGPIYMMYIIHPPWYYQAVGSPDANLKPVHEITVDGAPILRILRLK